MTAAKPYSYTCLEFVWHFHVDILQQKLGTQFRFLSQKCSANICYFSFSFHFRHSSDICYSKFFTYPQSYSCFRWPIPSEALISNFLTIFSTFFTLLTKWSILIYRGRAQSIRTRSISNLCISYVGCWGKLPLYYYCSPVYLRGVIVMCLESSSTWWKSSVIVSFKLSVPGTI